MRLPYRPSNVSASVARAQLLRLILSRVVGERAGLLLLLGLAAFLGVVAVAQAQQSDGAISGLTLTSDSPGTLSVTWDAPDPAPTDYRLRWAPAWADYLSWKVDNETVRGNAYPAGDATSLLLSGLMEGTEFKLQARARYHDGAHQNSPWSGPWAEASLQVAATPTPTAIVGADITGLTLASPGAGSLQVAWDQTVPQPSNYRVTWAKVEESYPTWLNNARNAYPTTAELDTIVGLESGAKYKVRVRARYDGDADTQPWSGPYSREAILRVRGAAPSGLRISYRDGAVRLNWQEPSPPGDATAVYHIWRTRLDSTTQSYSEPPIAENIEATSYRDDDVEPEYRYRYEVVIQQPGTLLSGPGEALEIEIPPVLDEGQAPGLGRLTLDGAEVAPTADGWRYEVEALVDVRELWFDVDSDAYDTEFSAQVIRGDEFILVEHDLDTPLPLSRYGDTLLLIDARDAEGEQQELYVAHVRGPTASTRSTGSSIVTRSTRSSSLTHSTRTTTERPRLSTLSVSPGLLDPPFDATVLEHSVTVGSDVSQITVTPTATGDSRLLMIPIDADTGVLGHQFTLRPSQLGAGPKLNVLIIIVADRESGRGEIYRLNVYREAPPDSDNALQSLALDGVPFEDERLFTPDSFYYSADVAADIDQVTLRAEARSKVAVVKFVPTDADAQVEGHQVSLAPGANEVSVQVSAEDGSLMTYVVNIRRGEVELATDAWLVALVASGLRLEPDFDPGHMNYQVLAPHSTTRLTLRVETHHDGATYEIFPRDADDATAGHQLELAEGENRVRVVVHAEDAVTTRTYSMTVVRAAPPASEARLRDLEVSGTQLQPRFNAQVLSYRVDLPHTSETATLRLSALDSSASIDVDPADADFLASGYQVDLDVGNNLVTIIVTAEDGATTRTYALTIVRATPPSSDASLSALGVTGAELSPAFDPQVLDYQVATEHENSQITLSLQPAHAGAYYAVSSSDADRGAEGHQLNLDVGDNQVAIVVTAEDGATNRRYRLTINRGGPPSDDASLRSLSVEGARLQPAFNAQTFRYWVLVKTDVDRLTLAPTARDAGASYVISQTDADPDTDGYQITLQLGENEVSIVVTAENGRDSQTYQLMITRAVPLEAKLRNLILPGYSLQPAFAPDVSSYTITTRHDATSVTIFAIASDRRASVHVSSPDIDPSQTGHQVAVAVGDTVVLIEVRTTDGMSNFYVVNFSRPLPPTSDATLAEIGIDGFDLSPAFDPAQTDYEVDLALETEVVTLRFRASDTDARVTPTLPDANPQADGHQLRLRKGEEIYFSLSVRAPDRSQTKQYRVVITRPYQSDRDASLVRLEIEQAALVPEFDPEITSYTATVAHDVSEITLRASTAQNNAQTAITPADGNPSARGHQVSIAHGPATDVTIEVASSDGVASRTYMVSITREPPPSPDASLASLNLAGETLRPVFSPEVLDYITAVSTKAGVVTVTAVAKEMDALVTVVPDDDDPLTNGHQVSFSETDQTISVTVLAPDGVASRTYTIIIQPASSEASLSSLNLVGETLQPTFSEKVLDYTAVVSASVSVVTVTAVAKETDAGITVLPEDADLMTAGHQVSFTGVALTISVTVLAPDGETERTYMVRVRPPSDDASLQSLRLYELSLSPAFTPDELVYAVTAPSPASSATLYARLTDSSATMVITPVDADTNQPGHQVNLSQDANAVTILVTAEDGTTTATYTVTITRGASGADDAWLSSLSLSWTDLNPAFEWDRYSYFARIPDDDDSTTLVATASNPMATITYSFDDADAAADGLQVGADEFDSPILITVTAPDGVTSRMYRVTLYEGAGSTQGGFVKVDVGEGVAACALRADGTMVCWNSSTSGLQPDGIFTDVNASKGYYCGVNAAGSIQCKDRYDRTAVVTPSRGVKGLVTDSGAMSENNNAGPIFSMAGNWYACRLNDDESVYCSGNTSQPPASLVAGPYKAIGVGQGWACGLGVNNLIRCWGMDWNFRGTEEFPFPEPDTEFSYIDAHRWLGCAVRMEDDSVLCWWPPGRGKAQRPTSVSFDSASHDGPFVAVAVGQNTNYEMCGLTAEGVIECFRDGRSPGSTMNLPIPDNGVLPYTQVSTEWAGYFCGLRVDATLRCWGDTRANRHMPSFESPWKDNSKLLGLSLEGLTLSAQFNRNLNAYSASAPNSLKSTTVVPELTNLFASYSITSDQDDQVDDNVVDLAVGTNVINVRVLSADGTSNRTYTVTVTRAAS